ncbi:class I adenylate-forming enzyme family protein [Thermoflavimicrobium dichotomicum]|uniref:Feruloyl-CoA synthase n=1 Tax=Thermoflavimicrobium dichotomicum TaxID=46223 RepID=A0A1I3UXP5_9BACL|nr:AMP-binding protein [Thermoflavimicrobium dichotomicum]SFJ87988.1 feruloyl-CoA synthase [Thermoflavimicrobium dichotomicum]
MILSDLLARNARKFGDRISIITRNVRMSYRQLDEESNRLARKLIQLGVQKGNHVGIISRNNEQFLRLYFAVLKCGAVVLPISVRFTAAEISRVVEHFDLTALFYEENFSSLIEDAASKEIIAQSIELLLEQCTTLPSNPPDIIIHEEDPCTLFLTSGTTGQPKGVLFNHKRVIPVATAIAIEFKHTPDDRVLHVMPFSHSAPLQTFFLGALFVGAVHIIDDYDPKRFINWILQEKVTTTFAAPIAYIMAAKQGISGDFSHVRYFAYGASAFPLAALERVKQAFGHDAFMHVYGLTETGPSGTCLRPEEHQTKNGSIGRQAVVNMEVKVVNDRGEETGPGEYGEILLKGESNMLGYYNNPEETAKVIRDGWVQTGDIAYRDKDGYIFIVDRKKDVIISGGVNIYPREIEEVLVTHPAVLEACVVGVAHPEWGETVKAVVVARPGQRVTEESLKEYISTRLADYKQPRLYSFVQALPRNVNGKVLKHLAKGM